MEYIDKLTFKIIEIEKFQMILEEKLTEYKLNYNSENDTKTEVLIQILELTNIEVIQNLLQMYESRLNYEYQKKELE